MGVVFDLLGKLVMDDEGKPLDVDPAGGDVGGDEELGALLFEGAHHRVALLLGEVALQDIDRKSELGRELLAEDDRARLGAAENDAAVVACWCLRKLAMNSVFSSRLQMANWWSMSRLTTCALSIFSRCGFCRHAVLDQARGWRPGMVAENSQVLCRARVRPKICASSFLKPMLSISSASSRIEVLHVDRA